MDWRTNGNADGTTLCNPCSMEHRLIRSTAPMPSMDNTVAFGSNSVTACETCAMHSHPTRRPCDKSSDDVAGHNASNATFWRNLASSNSKERRELYSRSSLGMGRGQICPTQPDRLTTPNCTKIGPSRLDVPCHSKASFSTCSVSHFLTTSMNSSQCPAMNNSNRFCNFSRLTDRPRGFCESNILGSKRNNFQPLDLWTCSWAIASIDAIGKTLRKRPFTQPRRASVCGRKSGSRETP